MGAKARFREDEGARVERRLALLAVIAALLALLPGVVGAQEARRLSLSEAVWRAAGISEELEVAKAAGERGDGGAGRAGAAHRVDPYREGLSTPLELSDARLTWHQAEVNRAVAAREVEMVRTIVRLPPDLPPVR